MYDSASTSEIPKAPGNLGVNPLRFPLVYVVAVDLVVAVFPLCLLASLLTFFTLFTAVTHNASHAQYRRIVR